MHHPHAYKGTPQCGFRLKLRVARPSTAVLVCLTRRPIIANGLDEPQFEGQAGEISASSLPGLVSNAVEVRPHGAHTDEEVLRDVDVAFAARE